MTNPQGPSGKEEPTVRRLEAIDTVHLEVRPAALEAMGDFYGRVLGMQSLQAGENALCFRVHKLEIRIRASGSAKRPLPHRRLTLEVYQLGAVRSRLRAEGLDYEITHEIGFGQPRVLVTDPAGHRLHLKQLWSF